MKHFIFILLLLTSCTKPKMDVISDFENLFDPKFSDNEPGGVVLVQKGDEVIFLKSYGVEDVDSKEPITPNTVFNTGSISKTFVSNGILILEGAQKLSLEDDLQKYFKDFDHPDIAKKVQIKHLLTHTSGLPDSRNVDGEFVFYLTAKDEENFEPLKHTDSLNFEPGSKFEYSNPAYNGLALIIEKVTNQKWQSFIRENIFNPAGMTDSKITDGPYPQEGVAHGYIRTEDGFEERDYGEEPTFAAAGNGGVWSSVLDLARYEKAIQNAVFLPQEVLERSRQITNPENWKSSKDPDVGYSWFIAEKENEGNEFDAKIISHTGWQGGFRAFMVSIPERDILYIGLFNRPIPHLSESFNPFTETHENASDVRLMGIRILKNHGWLADTAE